MLGSVIDHIAARFKVSDVVITHVHIAAIEFEFVAADCESSRGLRFTSLDVESSHQLNRIQLLVTVVVNSLFNSQVLPAAISTSFTISDSFAAASESAVVLPVDFTFHTVIAAPGA